MKTKIEFECPYTTGERYELVCTGEYGVFEMLGADCEVTGFRGTRRGYGITGVYDTYQDALEAAFTEFGPKAHPVKPAIDTTEQGEPVDYEELLGERHIE